MELKATANIKQNELPFRIHYTHGTPFNIRERAGAVVQLRDCLSRLREASPITQYGGTCLQS